MAAVLGFALSVGAQTTDEKQDTTQAPKAKAKTEENVNVKQEGATKQSAQSNKSERVRTDVDQNQNVNQPTTTRTKSEEKVRGDERHSGARVDSESAAVSHSTTVFRNGREVHESLALHRSTRERTDVHFSIGTHPRDWWLRTYSIVVMEGCHYFLADNGCWYPAYGFDPACNYPEGVVYCE